MKYLGPYGQLILSLRDHFSDAEIAKKLKEMFPNDGLKGLTSADLGQFARSINPQRIGPKLRKKTTKGEGLQTQTDAKQLSITAMIENMLREPDSHRKLMELIVYMEINEDADIAIERAFGWEPGALEIYRGEYAELYQASKIRHFEKLKEMYELEMFKTHQALAALCKPAMKGLKDMIEDKSTPSATRRLLIKDVIDATANKTALKGKEDERLADLSPEFEEAAASAQKQMRRRKKREKKETDAPN